MKKQYNYTGTIFLRKVSILFSIIIILIFTSCKSTNAIYLNKRSVELKRPVEMQLLLERLEVHLQTIEDILQRNRELAIQSSNGIYTEGDRSLIDLEFQELLKEICRIRQSAHFKGIVLLNSDHPNWLGKVSLKVDSQSDLITFVLPNFKPDKFGVLSWSLKPFQSKVHVKTPAIANDAIGFLDKTLFKIAFERARIGALYNRLYHIKNLQKRLSKKENRNVQLNVKIKKQDRARGDSKLRKISMIQKRIKKVKLERTALKEIKNKVKTLREQLRYLYYYNSVFKQKIIETEPPGFIEGNANNNTTLGTYKIKILKLASPLRITSSTLNPQRVTIPKGKISINDKKEMFSGGDVYAFNKFLNKYFQSILLAKVIHLNDKQAKLILESKEIGKNGIIKISDPKRILSSLNIYNNVKIDLMELNYKEIQMKICLTLFVV